MNEDSKRRSRVVQTSRGQLSLGELLCPTGNLRGVDAGQPLGWAFRTFIASKTLRHFRKAASACVVTSEGLQVGRDAAFWVIGYQTSTVQHRLLLPLVGPTVEELLSSVSREGLLLVFEGAENEPAFAVKLEIAHDQSAAFRNSHRALDSCPHLVDEMRAATSLLLDPQGLPPADNMPSPKQVSVTVVFPPELLAEDSL